MNQPPKPSHVPLDVDELTLACLDMLHAMEDYEPWEPLDMSTQTVLHLPEVINHLRGLASFYGQFKTAEEATRRFLQQRLQP